MLQQRLVVEAQRCAGGCNVAHVLVVAGGHPVLHGLRHGLHEVGMVEPQPAESHHHLAELLSPELHDVGGCLLAHTAEQLNQHARPRAIPIHATVGARAGRAGRESGEAPHQAGHLLRLEVVQAPQRAVRQNL